MSDETKQDDNFLKIQQEVEALQQQYENDPKQKSFSCLLLGELGSGKSFIARTARLPVHIDSFDPGGSKGLRDYIKAGKIIVDTRWEGENPKKPTVFRDWKLEMAKRVRMGYFDHIGTYILDSSTTWSDAIMNDILKKANIAGEAPRWAHDYVPQKVQIRNWIGEMMLLPCDFIMTGHLEAFTDEVEKTVTYRFLTTGKGTVTIPTLFDEVYVMDPKGNSKGVDYRMLTKSTGKHLARSRLAKEGLLDKYEEPDIKKLLKKAGFPCEDKPLFK